jgi:hypothetical protein
LRMEAVADGSGCGWKRLRMEAVADGSGCAWKRLRMEAVAAQLEALARILPGGTEDNTNVLTHNSRSRD